MSFKKEEEYGIGRDCPNIYQELLKDNKIEQSDTG